MGNSVLSITLFKSFDKLGQKLSAGFLEERTSMNLKNIVNKRNGDLLRMWLPSMATYGAGLGAMGIFFTSDWVGGRLMKFFPIYNKKYDKPAYNGASGN